MSVRGLGGPFLRRRVVGLAILCLVLLSVQVAVWAAAPEIEDQAFQIDENSANGAPVGQVVATDADLPDDTLTFALDSAGNTGYAFAISSTEGALTVNNSAALDYETTPVFSLTVRVTDSEEQEASATITVNLVDVNETPQADDATFDALPEHSGAGTFVGQVVATDPEQAPGTLGYAITGGDPQQAFEVSSSGEITVRSAAALDYETTPTFVLTVRVTDDGGLYDEATITVPLINVNEPPQVEAATFTVDENVPAGTFVGQVIATDPDLPEDTLSYSIVGGNTGQAFVLGTSGELTVNNPAALDYETQSVFNLNVRVNDGGGLLDTAAITVQVQDVNDLPQAQDDTRTVAEDSGLNPVYVRANDTDQDGDPLTVIGVSEAAHGIPSVAPNNLFVYYTPDDDYYGTDTFEYTLHDGRGRPVTATVTVTINGINDPPVAVDDWAETDEDLAVQIDVAANDTDLDGNPDPTTVEIVTVPQSGTITGIDPFTGAITYLPDANWSGSDSFTYRIRDDGSPTPLRWSAPGTVHITADPVLDFPIADAGEDQVVFLNAHVTLDGSGSEDPDGGTLRYLWIYEGDADLTLNGADTVSPTFTAPDEPAKLFFSLTVVDEDGWASTPDTVTVTVRSHPPLANAGPDQVVQLGDPVVLSGALSSDEDGDENLTYVWAQVDGEPTVTLEGSTDSPERTFTAPLSPTLLTFRLYVYDSFGTHDATLSQDEVRVEVRDPTVNLLYLPFVGRYHCPPGGNCGPDLVVQRLTVTSNDVEVVIANQGSRPVTADEDRFYVDAYIDPGRVPTRDDNWWDIPPHPTGIKWRVTASDLDLLVPGATLVLNRSNMLTGSYSNVTWPLSGGTIVYAQVDPYLDAVAEIDELNNLAGPSSP